MPIIIKLYNMFGKIKKIVYRLIHPFFWTRNMIIGILTIQIALASFLILWILYITATPEISYIKKALNTQRILIKNLKLANLEDYIWRPVLSCKDILSDDHYQVKKSNKIENKHCIPMSLSFSKTKLKNKYTVNHSKNIIEYGEAVEKPCLICHRGQSQASVRWVYHTSPQTVHHLLRERPKKVVDKAFIVSISTIFLFWFFYILIRLIMYYRGKLDVLALSFLREDARLPLKIFKQLGFKKSNFLYAELGEHFLRGYISRSIFLHWLESFIKNKRLNNSSHLLINIKASVMRVGSDNNFEGMRISQVITKKVEYGRIMLQQNILLDHKIQIFNKDIAKQVVWKIRPYNYMEPKTYQFVDLEFKSMSNLIKLTSLNKKNSKNG